MTTGGAVTRRGRLSRRTPPLARSALRIPTTRPRMHADTLEYSRRITESHELARCERELTTW